MKSRIATIIAAVAIAITAMGQNSVPAPGSGGSYNPAPVAPPVGGGPGWVGGGPGWGGPGYGYNPWGPGWNSYPTSMPGWQNSGVMNVVACGYDAQGIWRTLPLRVAYNYNGIQYNVTVLNAWNPWTQTWNVGVDMPAYSTTYYLRGRTFDYYAPLSTGTYYFNL